MAAGGGMNLDYLQQLLPLIQGGQQGGGAQQGGGGGTSQYDVMLANKQAKEEKANQGGGLDPGAKYDPVSKMVHGFRQKQGGGGAIPSFKRALGTIFG